MHQNWDNIIITVRSVIINNSLYWYLTMVSYHVANLVRNSSDSVYMYGININS